MKNLVKSKDPVVTGMMGSNAKSSESRKIKTESDTTIVRSVRKNMAGPTVQLLPIARGNPNAKSVLIDQDRIPGVTVPKPARADRAEIGRSANPA